ncbi:MAG: hypothetical protein ACXVAX_02090 [Pseudobdellovibrio sp.]
MDFLYTWYFKFFAFTCGYLLVCVQRKVPFATMAAAFGAGLLGGLVIFWPDKHEQIYSLSEHLSRYPYASLVTMAVVLIVIYKDKFYAQYSEGDVYLLTISFLYYLTPWHLYHKILAVIGVVPVLIVFYSALSAAKMTKTLRLLLAGWTFLLGIIYSLTQIFYNLTDLAELNNVQATEHFKALSYWAGLVLTAASGLYFISLLYPVLELARGKYESDHAYKLRLAQEEIPFFENRILSSQVPLRAILLISLLHGLPLLLNWYYQMVPHPMACSYAMLFSPAITFKINRLFKQA